MNDIIVVDLFAGCGGLSFGFKDCKIFAYEMNKHACSTLEKHIINGKVFCQEIDLNTKIEDHQILLGGPPCQPFSKNGNQKGNLDKRDMVPLFLKIMKEKSHLIAIMENVENLTSSKHKAYFDSIISEMKNMQYQVSYQIVNLVEYGIPQKRRRLFIIAHKGGFNFPEKTHTVKNNYVILIY